MTRITPNQGDLVLLGQLDCFLPFGRRRGILVCIQHLKSKFVRRPAPLRGFQSFDGCFHLRQWCTSTDIFRNKCHGKFVVMCQLIQKFNVIEFTLAFASYKHGLFADYFYSARHCFLLGHPGHAAINPCQIIGIEILVSSNTLDVGQAIQIRYALGIFFHNHDLFFFKIV